MRGAGYGLGPKGKLLFYFLLGATLARAGEYPCPFGDLFPLLYTIPGLQFRSNEAKDFKLVKEFLTGQAVNWFQLSIPLDPKWVDPYFVEVAKLSGGQAFFGGGSDLIEVGLLHAPKTASPGEVNVIRPRKVYDEFDVDKEWTFHKLVAPAWGSRKATEETMGINGESGRDLRVMVDNANAGKYLIENQPFINVPFKHGHIVRVNEKGEARLYFRTRQDFMNYRAKKLSLPDEDHYPNHLQAQLVDRPRANYLHNTVKYGLIVYARAAGEGWTYTPKSKEILQNWVTSLKASHKAEAKVLVEDLKEAAARQSVPPETMKRILAEFQLEPLTPSDR